ncbi:MAG: nuclear transport factor 2 family protein [Acidobacteriota bacterium]
MNAEGIDTDNVRRGFDAVRIARLTFSTLGLGKSMQRAMRRWLRTRVRSLVLIALVGALPAFAPAQAHGRHEHKRIERTQVIALEHEWRQAVLSNDVSAMDRLLSDDYLGITSGGEVLTKAQQLDRMRERTLVITQLDTSETKIKLIGSIAIVTCLARVKGASEGGSIDGAYRYTRVYQRLPGGVWKVTNFEATPALRLHPAATLQ